MSCAVHPLEHDTLPCARCGAAYCDDCLVLLKSGHFCAACKQNELMDVVSGTHEDIRLARLLARVAAYGVDRAMYYALLIGAFLGTVWIEDQLENPNRNWGAAVVMFVMNAAWVIYEGEMLARRGQTLGKMAAKVRVVRRDGTPLTRVQAWSRAAIRTFFITAWLIFASATAMSYSDATLVIFCLGVIDPIVAAFTSQRMTIHDFLARTRVYRAE